MRIQERVSQSGLSLRQVSTRSGISAERLNAVMLGAEPSIIELHNLADALGISIAEFGEASEPEKRAALLFRNLTPTRSSSTTAAVNGVSRRVGQAFEILPPDPGGMPSWIREFTHRPQAEPEHLAEEFRSRYFAGNQVAPLLHLPSILVNELDVLLYVIDHSELEGASAVLGGYSFLFVARRSFPPRMLFTVAHELGHLLAHHPADDDCAFVDTANDIAPERRRRRLTEAFADSFAACLLLPRAGLGIALKKIRELLKVKADAIGHVELLYLSRFFGVSFQVAGRRCEDLGLIPSGGGQSLYEELTKRHGNPERYADQLGLPPRDQVTFPAVPPRLLHEAVEAIRNGRVSLGRASSILNVAISDLFRVHSGAWQT